MVRFIGDVIAGWALGTAIGALVVLAARRLGTRVPERGTAAIPSHHFQETLKKGDSQAGAQGLLRDPSTISRMHPSSAYEGPVGHRRHRLSEESTGTGTAVAP